MLARCYTGFVSLAEPARGKTLMHAHDKPEQQDHEGGHAPRPNVPASLPAGFLSPGNVLALQRQVGNAAVARMLAERENPFGGQPLVQRSAVHEVLRSPG